MKKYKILSVIFRGMAILLSDIMCATVSYIYADMRWGSRYAVYSAPAGVAFLGVIPWGIGILICILLAVIFHKKFVKTQQNS